MKQTVLLAGFLLATLLLHAQLNHPHFLTEISVGPSFPVGKFGDKNFDIFNLKNPPGLAKTGVSASLSLGYYLNRSIAVLVSAGYSEHKQDWDGYGKYIRSLPNGDGPADFQITAETWKAINIMGGGFFVIPLTPAHKLNVTAKLLAGGCKSAIPAFTGKSYDVGGVFLSESKYSEVDLKWAFCYQAGVGLQYKLTRFLHVQLEVNSFNATAKMPARMPSYSNAVPVIGNSNMSTVNAQAGLGIDL
ncbi:hypothetical protein A4H97_07865 [Niastella yeongjuensis]|uniref:Outer membrane protein beta-barrel domain-containing protein n=1 Tax=Niastella yeongjuensis TaxID=354355 RepID=A0A1V9EMN3_9BACT|nr:hypothetical protein [Niastella yeongjuensis]OQP47407.1 hypothetical protein A4H97_07865 [Niastella yeongjuensis]SEN82571.1 hypothetical protein SAMN05660816_01597 [Niastella yeongjuensis]